MQSRTRFFAVSSLLLAVASVALRAEDYAFATFAGTTLAAGTTDGTPGLFNGPYGIAIDSAKNLYVADTVNHTIRMITPARVVSTLAGSGGASGSTNGTGSAARFSFPTGVAVDPAGNVYVADSGNFEIRKITPAGVVTTYAGTPFGIGSADGPASSAQFNLPQGVAIDAAGNLYVADRGNNAIRKISAAGIVSTLAGTAGQEGFVNGAGSGARFRGPFGLAVDSAGNVYVADTDNNAIRKITPAGVVTTLAGILGTSGAEDDAPARFNHPRGVATDASGNVFVADYGNSVIRQIAPNGIVTTLAGAAGVAGAVDSTGAAARFYSPTGIVADGTTLYAADTANNVIRKGVPASSANVPTITVQPIVKQVVNVGQPATFSVTASGTNLTYQWLKSGAAISGATSASFSIASAQPGDSGSYTVRITGTGGSIDSAQATLSVEAPGFIVITSQPVSQTVTAGQSATFSVAATGTGLTYQWLKNSAAIGGATGTSFTISAAQSADAGNYSVRLTGADGIVESAPATLTVIPAGPAGPASRLSNLSVRTAMASGQTLIVGVVVDGGPRDILVRAAGPALAAFGLASAMADPRLDLFNQGSTLTFSNEDWPASLAGTFASVGAFAFPAGSKDAAFVQSIDGAYSIQARGTGPGVVLVEAYDTGPGTSSRLINVSARNSVGTGENILIAGFIVTGTDPKQLLIRAVGPGLAVFGVGGVLADPKLELYDGSGVKVTENDNWSSTLAGTFTSVGAFGLDAGSKDAALLTTLPPDSYTVQVKGADGGTGEALIEVYEVP